MGIIKQEDIRGYRIGEQMVCQECTEKDELKDLKQSEIIEAHEIENSDDHYFCDRCEKEL